MYNERARRNERLTTGDKENFGFCICSYRSCRFVAAVSCGIVNGQPLLDLDFEEDSNAETDSNFVITGSGGIVEIQGTAEKVPFTEAEFLKLLSMARAGIVELIQLQKKVIALLNENKD